MTKLEIAIWSFPVLLLLILFRMRSTGALGAEQKDDDATGSDTTGQMPAK